VILFGMIDDCFILYQALFLVGGFNWRLDENWFWEKPIAFQVSENSMVSQTK
tara:strand:+ start:87852 stop:88007 length:156 start_codon:yes stop_codon:yes gene_type:complete